MRFAFACIFALACASPLTFGQDELQYRQRPNRFEGIKPKPVGGYDLELLSARVDFKEDWNALGERLRVRFFLKEPAEVFLTVRELEYKHYYWLDNVVPIRPWQLGYDNVFEWPAKDVLGRLRGLKPTDLGVVARLDKPAPSGKDHVAPVLFYHRKPPARVTGYVFTFKLRDDASVKARIVRESEDSVLMERGFEERAGGRPFSVKWDFAGAEPPEGRYKLVLTGFFLDSNDRITQTVTFYHQPVVAP